jgi:hypothetical protein
VAPSHCGFSSRAGACRGPLGRVSGFNLGFVRAILVGFLLFACLLFPREAAFELMTLREGFPAKRDLIAPFQFYLLKDRDRLRAEQLGAARHVTPVYSADESVEARVRATLDSLRAAEAPVGQGWNASRLRAMGLSGEAVRIPSGRTEAHRHACSAHRRSGLQHWALPERDAARIDTDAPSVRWSGAACASRPRGRSSTTHVDPGPRVDEGSAHSSPRRPSLQGCSRRGAAKF